MNVFVQKIGEDTPTQVTHDTIRDVGGYSGKAIVSCIPVTSMATRTTSFSVRAWMARM